MIGNPMTVAKGDSDLAARLRQEIEGEVLFDVFSRGRYSTDASIYQIDPIGVVVPKTAADVSSIMEIAVAAGAPVLPRGGGTSQCGQTVGEALVVDVSKHLNTILELDVEARTAWVEPGLVLDSLNSVLKPHGLWFPVDVSTSSRATIGGMAGNNSCGARSIRYGPMRDNVRAIDAVLVEGGTMRFGEVLGNVGSEMVGKLLDIGRREAEEIRASFPDLMRRVGGYNIDALMPDGAPRGDWAAGTVADHGDCPNLAHLLVGSEGTLAFSTRLQLILQALPRHKVLGVCHFPSFHQAMESAQHIVGLNPSAVELVDRTMIELSREIPMFQATVKRFVRGQPEALLLVEFAGDDAAAQGARLRQLVDLMANLGLSDAVVEVTNPVIQTAVWEVRKSGLNIMMSMKGDGKPISFIEDCAVRLEDLAEYTARLTEVFEKHGTTGTWYAHASVGCLHVRPVLNLKSDIDVKKMRDIAEEAFAMIREYKGSHSGEHGDGLVRSEFHQPMFGSRMVETFAEVKSVFDPGFHMNPGKIVDPPAMDDRALFRFKPGYAVSNLTTALDWSAWGGFGGAVEMCNNNGACRKRDAGVLCPSYRVTGNERDLTRGRANTLRLAISGQLGADALTNDDMAETMKLCVSCKGCKRECPTGVDMARMKIEFLDAYTKRHGLRLFDRIVAYLPRYASWASRIGGLIGLRNRMSGLAWLGEALAGFSAHRRMPEWHALPFHNVDTEAGSNVGREVVFWADTFNTWFEPDNARSAVNVLTAAGYRVHLARPVDGDRPLCCGRTFLAAGLVDEAKVEGGRVLDALVPFAERGVPIIGLEPSCLLTLRDELMVILPGERAETLAGKAMLLEEFLAAEEKVGRLDLAFNARPDTRVLLHGHCHQKAFGVMGDVEKVLRLIPKIQVDLVESSCCGMAGAFGYHAETYNISMKMAELSLLPAVRNANLETVIVADGTSCRHQIADGAGRAAIHVARVLEEALSHGCS